MTTTCKLLTGVLVLVALCAAPSLTRAYDGCCPQSWLDAPGFGCGGSLYGLGYIPVPPYYALHPPVYYGQQYYRSYGESPFARTDYSSRPQRIRAQVIINPFVEQPAPSAAPPAPPADEAKPAPDQVTAGPQVIINPYYQVEPKVASRE